MNAIKIAMNFYNAEKSLKLLYICLRSFPVHVRCQLGILLSILNCLMNGNPQLMTPLCIDCVNPSLANPPIQSSTTLLLPHGMQRLPKWIILVSLFTQTRSCHLVWIRNAGGNCLGYGASHHELQEVAGTLCVRMPLIALLQLRNTIVD